MMRERIRQYFSLIKPLQTGLLLATGLAGFMSAAVRIFNLGTLLGLAGSLFLAISGSTLLNMWWTVILMPRCTALVCVRWLRALYPQHKFYGSG